MDTLFWYVVFWSDMTILGERESRARAKKASTMWIVARGEGWVARRRDWGRGRAGKNSRRQLASEQQQQSCRPQWEHSNGAQAILIISHFLKYPLLSYRIKFYLSTFCSTMFSKHSFYKVMIASVSLTWNGVPCVPWSTFSNLSNVN